jgi:hypothetical protein
MLKRKRYSSHYKWEIVELVCRPEASCRQIALEADVNPSLLDPPAGSGKRTPAASKALLGGGTPRTLRSVVWCNRDSPPLTKPSVETEQNPAPKTTPLTVATPFVVVAVCPKNHQSY